jgi:methylthioribose-1-phosphate isomerase
MEVIKAIEQMLARGAGDIAITARYGLYLAK